MDLDVLLSKASEAKATLQAVHHTTAKIVLVGDSGVGKTGLGWRLAHGEFKEHASTHGQQFWVLNELGTGRKEGTECEAILWDLAGQPDYRLTHALFLDDADLALILFDPTDSRDPLHSVEFWLKQLKSGQTSRSAGQRAKSAEKQCACPTILVGARADRGEARLTKDELDAFCHERGIVGGYLSTSVGSRSPNRAETQGFADLPSATRCRPLRGLTVTNHTQTQGCADLPWAHAVAHCVGCRPHWN